MTTNDPDVPRLQALRVELAKGVKKGEYTQAEANRLLGVAADSMVASRGRKREVFTARRRK